MFMRKSGHNLVESAVLTAIGTNKFLSGEFRVFHGKWSLVDLRCCHGDFDGNLKCGGTKFVQLCYRLGCFF